MRWRARGVARDRSRLQSEAEQTDMAGNNQISEVQSAALLGRSAGADRGGHPTAAPPLGGGRPRQLSVARAAAAELQPPSPLLMLLVLCR